MVRSSWRTPLVILVCGTAIALISFGVRTAFGVFLQPVSADLGWGREVFALALAVQNLLWGASQPFTGAIADRFGAARVATVAAVLYVLGVYLMSQAETPLDIVLSNGVLIGLGLSGTGFTLILSVVSQHAPAHRRSLYIAIASAGGSSGQLIMAPLGQSFLAAYGWSTALVLLAVICCLMVPLAAALAAPPGVSAGSRRAAPRQSVVEALREAGSHPGFWYLNAGFFVCGFHVIFIATHLPAYIVDSGQPASLGASALALIGFGNIIGSYSSGILGGRYSRKYMLSSLYLARAVVIATFVLVPVSAASILAFAFAMGLLWLSTVPLTGGLVSQIFGVRHMGMLFGIVFFSHQVGGFLGAWLGGRIYDETGSYDIVWWVAVALGVAAAALHWPINERPVPRLAAAEEK